MIIEKVNKSSGTLYSAAPSSPEPVSVSNFHGNHLGRKFRMNYIPKKVEIRDGSFSGIQNGKRSMLPAIFRNF
jgi:hypothetical protein